MEYCELIKESKGLDFFWHIPVDRLDFYKKLCKEHKVDWKSDNIKLNQQELLAFVISLKSNGFLTCNNN